MSRYIIIRDCEECPYSVGHPPDPREGLEWIYTCRYRDDGVEYNKEIGTMPRPIPDWCPLPESEVKG